MDHYFTNNQTLKSSRKLMEINVNNKIYSLYSDNGVFSKNGLDYGTRLLIENLPLDMLHGKVLDVGCGYGPIGIYIAKETDCEVDMIDVNIRAIHLAQMSLKENKVKANIYESDAYSNVKEKYDYIITNPPIRAGKIKVMEILLGAEKLLNQNGELWFVMRKDQGVKSTISQLESIYKVSIVEKKKGFFIVCATKGSKIVDIAWLVW